MFFCFASISILFVRVSLNSVHIEFAEHHWISNFLIKRVKEEALLCMQRLYLT